MTWVRKEKTQKNGWKPSLILIEISVNKSELNRLKLTLVVGHSLMMGKSIRKCGRLIVVSPTTGPEDGKQDGMVRDYWMGEKV